MKVQNKVIAFGYRTGTSTKEGKNNGKSYLSFTALDFEGNAFDVFQWDNGTFPKRLDCPCLLECTFDVTRSNDKTSLDVVSIDKKSPQIDLTKVLGDATAKISLEKVV